MAKYIGSYELLNSLKVLIRVLLVSDVAELTEGLQSS